MSAEGWTDINLESTIEFRNGKSSPLRSENGLNPVFGGNGIIGFTDESNSNFETVIVGRVGAYCGNVYYHKGKCWVTDNAIIGKVREQCDGLFLYYLLKSIGLNNHRTGSSQPLVNQSILNSIKVKLPKEKQTQSRIASILSALDEKIELNRQTNATLEAIAQAIFREWFVDFNFPGATGEMVESELGMIPRGWRMGTLGEEGTFKNGINYSRDENGDSLSPIVNVRDIVESKFISKQNLDSVQINKQKAFPYLLSADDILLVRSASPGETAILLQPEQDIIYSGFTIRYRLIKKEYFLYLFFIFQNLKNALDHISNGTTLKNINQEMLKPYKVIIPNVETIIEFNNLIKPIFDSIQNTNQQSATLAATRDALLPKLMSGEVEV